MKKIVYLILFFALGMYQPHVAETIDYLCKVNAAENISDTNDDENTAENDTEEEESEKQIKEHYLFYNTLLSNISSQSAQSDLNYTPTLFTQAHPQCTTPPPKA